MAEKRQIVWLIKVAFGCLLLDILLFPLRGYGPGFTLSSGVSFFILGGYAVWCMHFGAKKGIRPTVVLGWLLLGWLMLNLPLRIYLWNGSKGSLLEVMMRMAGIFAGYLFYVSSRIGRISVVAAGLIVSLYVYFKGYDDWLHYLNFGSVSGWVHTNAPIEFIDEYGNKVSVGGQRGDKIYVLDFWSTSCGRCFRKFPEVEEMYREYRDHPAVAIYAVNIPREKDGPDKAYRMIRERGYDFPVGILSGREDMKEFGINGYPAVLMIDRSGRIVFKGTIEKARVAIGKLLE